jgi:hypothetical protein
VQLIAITTTKKGLKVSAELDEGGYPTGVKASAKELAAVPLSRNEFHGDWTTPCSRNRSSSSRAIS